MKRLYSRGEDELCYEKSVHLQYMIDNGIKEMEVTVMKVDRDSGFFFCSKDNVVGEKGFCGINNCHQYKPKNGKSGCCLFSRMTYEEDKKMTFTLKNFLILTSLLV